MAFLEKFLRVQFDLLLENDKLITRKNVREQSMLDVSRTEPSIAVENINPIRSMGVFRDPPQLFAITLRAFEETGLMIQTAFF